MKYDKYKNSDIEWIREIPQNWEVKKFKYYIKDIQKSNIDVNLSEENGKYIFYTSSEGKYRYTDEPIYQKESLIIGDGGVFNINYSNILFSASSHCIVYTFKSNINVKFIYYFLKSIGNVINELAFNGIGIKMLQRPFLNNTFICFTELKEQYNIVKYLDLKTAQIDLLINNKERQIELLREKRRSVLNSLVCMGLNQNIKETKINNPMITVDKIPNNYNMVKFKYIAQIKSNLVDPQKYLNYNHIAPDNIEKNNARVIFVNTVEDDAVESFNHLFNKGQIIYSKIRPELNKLILSEFNGLCSADMYPIDTKINAKFLMYYMLSDNFLNQTKSVSQIRIKMPKINQDEMNNLICIVPPLKEQIKIVKYLDNTTNFINSSITKIQNQINLLKEYKQSLIYEVVTGKKKVLTNIDNSLINASLACKIIDKSDSYKKTGKIKLVKLMYLCQKIIKDVNEIEYKKDAAGPHNIQVFDEIYNIFNEKDWVGVVKDSKLSKKDNYNKLEKFEEYQEIYNQYYADNNSQIENIISLFNNSDTQECERVATLYAVWNDFIIDGIEPTEEQIITATHNWSDRKKNITTKNQLKKNLKWMKDNQIVPVGFGRKTGIK